ncbi:MAG: hypothetical protein H7236_11815 [Gemmatimonadaceae bacterium]|nr:hypothetical protein [Caulobacter sp.]
MRVLHQERSGRITVGMGLALFRQTSGWVAMLCVAIALSLAGQTAAQAFEMADHAGHHATQAAGDVGDDHHHCDDAAIDDPASPGDPAGEPHQHHVDHHAVGLGVDLAMPLAAPAHRQSVAPARSVHHAGLAGCGLKRPPKA